MINKIYYEWISEVYGAGTGEQMQSLPSSMLTDLYWEVCCFGPAGNNVETVANQVDFLLEEHKEFFAWHPLQDEEDPEEHVLPLLHVCHKANQDFILTLKDRAKEQWSASIQEAVFQNVQVYSQGVAVTSFQMKHDSSLNYSFSVENGLTAFLTMVACEGLFDEERDAHPIAYYRSVLEELGLIAVIDNDIRSLTL